MVPTLSKLIETEADENVLQTAIRMLVEIGAGAKPTVVMLRAKAESSALPRKRTLVEAGDAIEKAEVKTPSELEKSRMAIRRDIGAFVKARGEKKNRWARTPLTWSRTELVSGRPSENRSHAHGRRGPF